MKKIIVFLHMKLKSILLIFTIATVAFIGCKSKKSLSGSDEIDATEFVDFFDDIKLPINLSDTSFKRKISDSAVIGEKIIGSFLNDTIFSKQFKESKPKVYAIGKFKNEDTETYLVLKAVQNKKEAYYVAVLDENYKYITNMFLIGKNIPRSEVSNVEIDTRLNFNIIEKYKQKDGSYNQFTEVKAYNNVGVFMVILTNGLKKGEHLEIINPIDTLPSTHKLSGDYEKNDRNFITIRDNNKSGKLNFFLYFDQDNGQECYGELKGEMTIVKADSAYYQSPTDPCKIGFKFSGNKVIIKEQVNCGNKRPMNCTFNASYTKKKAEVKKTEPKKTEQKKATK
ncbi:hypothetical protein O3P16_12200 [Chitinophagaceae bacterium LY-5]|uniref:Lipoprotein n=2 Tax=Polluticaenibacter yanchengensis TaxID=3014562 RepID=A0ABT4UL56_9BACT|nr:hypothetical protein [Chitinophagaceae bacterium LY-5]